MTPTMCVCTYYTLDLWNGKRVDVATVCLEGFVFETCPAWQTVESTLHYWVKDSGISDHRFRDDPVQWVRTTVGQHIQHRPVKVNQSYG